MYYDTNFYFLQLFIMNKSFDGINKLYIYIYIYINYIATFLYCKMEYFFECILFLPKIYIYLSYYLSLRKLKLLPDYIG